jgi:DNA-binding transcriptional MerR regulator
MAGARLKMRDLERRTGVGRETIRFYIREGLLPEPERPGRNVAWYDESFVERVRLIKELQERRYLPLAVIKTIVTGDARPTDAEIDALLALEGRLAPAASGRPAAGPERLAALARRTGLAVRELRELADAGLVAIETRDGDQWLGPESVQMVECWARLRSAGFEETLGFRAADVRLYVDVVRMLAREELRVFTRGITGRVESERATQMAEEGIETVNRMLALLRRETLLRFVAEGNVPAGDAPAAGEGRAAGGER